MKPDSKVTYTILAPTDVALRAMPAGLYDSWLMPANEGWLRGVLMYHVVPETLTEAEIRNRMDRNNGRAKVKTMGGEVLVFLEDASDRIWVEDALGNRSLITATKMSPSNGMIWNVDRVFVYKENPTLNPPAWKPPVLR
jgi:uncharacterized surface protein with fasciclin (FAS1) repeats